MLSDLHPKVLPFIRRVLSCSFGYLFDHLQPLWVHAPIVRRHGFLDRPQLELSEYLAHLFVDVKRPACGIASAVR